MFFLNYFKLLITKFPHGVSITYSIAFAHKVEKVKIEIMKHLVHALYVAFSVLFNMINAIISR